MLLHRKYLHFTVATDGSKETSVVNQEEQVARKSLRPTVTVPVLTLQQGWAGEKSWSHQSIVGISSER